MQKLPKSEDPRLIVGAEGFSDAGVFQVHDELYVVQSLDFFAPLIDDPFRYGQIAAANSLGDIFAMGADPITALNIVCFPDDRLDLDILSEILRGGTDKVHEAGASVVGGHSIRDPEIKYGLSATGIATPDQLITNQGAQPGDVLVLTKAIGTGFITTAIKSNRCDPSIAETALESMSQLNRAASLAARAHRANAATDITGFGLATHACELATSSGVTMVIELHKIPLLPGASEYAKKGLTTRANKTNRAFCQPMLEINAPADDLLVDMMFDPQTSGGLLISVPENRVQELVEQAQSQGATTSTVIGWVEAKQSHALKMIN